MAASRRQFIRHIGIALTGLVVARCKPVVTCYIPAEITATPGAGSGTTRGRLRDCWLKFGWLAERTQAESDEEQMGQDELEALQGEHRAALDELVAAGELSAAVAEQVQTAFDEAAYHIWRSNAPMTCYEPVLVDYQPTSAAQLVEQSGILSEMAVAGNLDPATVDKAQAAIEHEIAFMNLSSADTQALYEQLTTAAGDAYNFPAFEELELEVTPEAAEAARFLVDLLLAQPE